jgi:ATP-dependent DNA helicase RecG
MVALVNSKGGHIYIGVSDFGEIVGLSPEDIRRTNQLISNTATNNVKNSINPLTEIIEVDGKFVLIVVIIEGMDKPYLDSNGVIWVKSGSDKRRVTSREEMRRMFQASDLIHADEIPVKWSTIKDLNFNLIGAYFFKVFKREIKDEVNEISQIAENLGLIQKSELTLAGLLLFAKNPQRYKPQFSVKAVSFFGDNLAETLYRDNEDIEGTLENIYNDTIAFLRRNLKKIQMGQSFNSLGKIEIPLVVLEEITANAIMHRNYFIDAPIRVFIFDDRVEIISPGTLPNNLNIEKIKSGISNMRNPVISSFVTKGEMLPYRGLGTGILRSLMSYDEIDFDNDTELNQFRVIIKRPYIG